MPVWWERRAFFLHFGERRLDTGYPVYVDYGLLLTQNEGLAWDAAYRESHGNIARDGEAMQQWTALLKAAKWVIVESYE